MAGDLTFNHEKCLRTMLILDSIRGEDSTGVAVVGKGSNAIKTAKQVGDPFQLFDHKSFDKVMQGSQRVMIGHNRYATSGAVRRDTAHPFENDSYVGAHNGTLKNKWKLADANNYVVDSENLYHHMHKHGLEDLLATMDGAWALTWWDKENGTINFLRNDQRPLFLAFSKDSRVLFWASEPWMIAAALNKHNLEYEAIDLMPVDVHISIAVALNGIMGKPVLRRAKSTYAAPPAVIDYRNREYKNGAWVDKAPPATNVVAITKKEEPVNATVKKPETGGMNAAGYENFYINAKGRKLELLNVSTDIHKQKFIACFDPDRETYEIRLYPPLNHMIWEMIGEDIVADINGWNSGGSLAGKGYYRVSPDNFKVVVPPETEKEPTVMGPTGKLLTEREFLAKWPRCGFCDAELAFDAPNRHTTAGECMCPDCSTSDQVVPFVNFH